MSESDLDEVMQVEREAFTTPWTREMYRAELSKEDGIYVVARLKGDLAGYGGMLMILEEGHLMTLAVKKKFRRRGVATVILLHLFREVVKRGGRFVTLEVRPTNRPALSLYAKFGFEVMGVRRGYYMDNLEDALIMWTEDITSPGYRELLDKLEKGVKDVGGVL